MELQLGLNKNRTVTFYSIKSTRDGFSLANYDCYVVLVRDS